MSDTGPEMMSCERLRPMLEQGRALTAAESVHVEGCNACLEAWLDATVTKALYTKPEVPIPADFAARVAARLPEKSGHFLPSRGYDRPWGLLAAILLVVVGLVAMAVADPVGLNTRLGMIFMGLVVTEIAGIALWLGPKAGN